MIWLSHADCEPVRGCGTVQSWYKVLRKEKRVKFRATWAEVELKRVEWCG